MESGAYEIIVRSSSSLGPTMISHVIKPGDTSSRAEIGSPNSSFSGVILKEARTQATVSNIESIATCLPGQILVTIQYMLTFSLNWKMKKKTPTAVQIQTQQFLDVLLYGLFDRLVEGNVQGGSGHVRDTSLHRALSSYKTMSRNISLSTV